LAVTPNEALKLTKGADGRAPHHSASLRRSYVPQRTFFTNVPSQPNPSVRRTTDEREVDGDREGGSMLIQRFSSVCALAVVLGHGLGQRQAGRRCSGRC